MCFFPFFSTYIFQLNDSIELVILQTTISIENTHRSNETLTWKLCYGWAHKSVSFRMNEMHSASEQKQGVQNSGAEYYDLIDMLFEH